MKITHLSRLKTTIFLLLASYGVCAQNDSEIESMPSAKAIKAAYKDLERVTNSLKHSTNVFVKSFQSMERALSISKDSSFSINKLQNITAPQMYQPKLDSLSTSLKYTSSLFGSSSSVIQKESIDKVQEELKDLTYEFDRAQKIKTLVEANISNNPNFQQLLTARKKIMHYKKLASDYKARLKETQELINNPEKLGRRLLDEIRQQKAFQKYFSKYAELARLFPASESPMGNLSSIPGLQQRDQLMQRIKDVMGGSAIDPIQLLQTQQESTSKPDDVISQTVQSLKSKIASSSQAEQPSPGLKGLSFPKRLFFQANVQSTSGNRFLPSHSAFAFGAGYKINARTQVSTDLLWKMGWGQPIKNIRISHQGYGVRGYLDCKLRGDWWLTGSYERSYFPAYALEPIAVSDNGWRNGALLGVTKTVALKSKWAKKFKVQLLYDFLAASQLPFSSPWKYRMGYTF
jgi:hypothetical protein